MLSDAEYEVLEGVDPTQFEGDVDMFTWFTLPVEQPTMRGGQSTPLWGVKPVPPPEEKVDTERRDNLRKYIRRGYAFDPLAK
jgi:hypothetical protein